MTTRNPDGSTIAPQHPSSYPVLLTEKAQALKAFVGNAPSNLDEWSEVIAAIQANAAAIQANADAVQAHQTAIQSNAALIAANTTALQTAQGNVSTLLADYNKKKEGVYVPIGWGANWRAARALAGSRLVHIVGWGDSIMQGFFASDFRTKSFFGKMITDLQTLYGDGGSGYLSTINTSGLVFAGGALYMTKATNWASQQVGINETSVYPNTAGQTLTIPGIRGEWIDIYYTSGAGAATQSAYKIDALGAFNLNTVAETPQTYKSTQHPGVGTHSLVITASASPFQAVDGVTGYNTVGIIGHNMGRGSRPSSAGQLTTATGSSGKTSGQQSITDFTPDLIVIEGLAPNDIASSVTVDAFLSNVSRRIMDAKAYANGVCDVVLVLPHRGNQTDASFLYAKYAAAMRALAEALGCAFIDFWALGRLSWDYWNSLGYWGVTNGSTGVAGTDVIHPSDAGHAYMANTVRDLLLT